MTAFTFLESERALLRRFTDGDLLLFLAYLNDPLVARYQTWESYTEQQAKDVIDKQKNLDPGVPGQWFTFAVELKEAGALIGHVALKMQDHQQAEIGFTFSRDYQGKGLAREAATGVMDYAFTKLELHRVIAITDCENERSVTLLSRLGCDEKDILFRTSGLKVSGEMSIYMLLTCPPDEYHLICHGLPGSI